MSRRVVGMALIVVGGAGLVIPVMPGWLLIAAGASIIKKANAEGEEPTGVVDRSAGR